MSLKNPPDLTAAVLRLAKHGIPVDVQELLLAGDPMRGIRPGALLAAIAAVRNAALEDAARIPENFTSAAHIAHDLRTGAFPRQSDLQVAIAAAIRSTKTAPAK